MNAQDGLELAQDIAFECRVGYCEQFVDLSCLVFHDGCGYVLILEYFGRLKEQAGVTMDDASHFPRAASSHQSQKGHGQIYAAIVLGAYAEMAFSYLITALRYIFRTADPPRLLHLYKDAPI